MPHQTDVARHDEAAPTWGYDGFRDDRLSDVLGDLLFQMHALAIERGLSPLRGLEELHHWQAQSHGVGTLADAWEMQVDDIRDTYGEVAATSSEGWEYREGAIYYNGDEYLPGKR